MRTAPILARTATTVGLLAAIAGAAGANPAADAAAPDRPVFDDAMTHYERNQWPQAYSLLSALADAGDADAARVALLMSRHGQALYGTRFEASASRRARWLAAAASQPRTLARLDAD